jgi:hypothetical protein
MGEYRHTETGAVKSQGEWRRHYSNTSLPRTWTAATLQGLKLEAVLEAPKPTAGQYQTVVRNGVEQDSNGNWVTAWAVRDMFADTTAEDGTVTTKAEQEAAYQSSLDAKAAESVRAKRNSLIAETDYLALTDNTLDDTTIAYRQALRDITSHVNFPYLNEEDWPVKPV